MSLDAVVYFLLLGFWSLAVAYYALFVLIPYMSGKQTQNHGSAHHAPAHHPLARPASHALVHHPKPHPEVHGRFSAHIGFKSFARGVELTIEDIVKGLSRDE